MNVLLCAFLVACSSNDDDDNNSNEPLTGNFFPSTVEDLWTYDVESTNSNNSNLNFNETDFLKVGTSNGASFTLVANNNISPANGAFNSILVNGTLSGGESTLTFSGDLNLPDEFSEFSNNDISLQNFILYDLSASNNQILSEESGSFSQDLDLDGSLLPLTITYTVTSTKLSSLNSLNVGDESYSNVVRANIVLTMKVVTSIDLLGLGNPVDYDLLPTQEVISIENYFAQDIGLIKSDAVISYQLDEGLLSIFDDLQIEIGIPDSLTVTNNQELESYLISD